MRLSTTTCKIYCTRYTPCMDTWIEVRLNVKDMPLNDGPEKYYEWLEAKLKDSGIPVDGDQLMSGTLHRFDDPNNFGVTIYRWEPL